MDEARVGPDDAVVAEVDRVPSVTDLSGCGPATELVLGQRPERVTAAYDDAVVGAPSRPLGPVRQWKSGDRARPWPLRGGTGGSGEGAREGHAARGHRQST